MIREQERAEADHAALSKRMDHNSTGAVSSV